MKGWIWEFVKTFQLEWNWNKQTGALARWLEGKFHEHNGYHAECVQHLAACVLLMQTWHKHKQSNQALSDFKQKLMTDGTIAELGQFEHHYYKQLFLEFCKTCDALKPFNMGMSGCWNPCWKLGQAFCVHVMIPTFDKWTKNEDIEQEIRRVCYTHHQPQCWHAIADMHPSEKNQANLKRIITETQQATGSWSNT